MTDKQSFEPQAFFAAAARNPLGGSGTFSPPPGLPAMPGMGLLPPHPAGTPPLTTPMPIPGQPTQPTSPFFFPPGSFSPAAFGSPQPALAPSLSTSLLFPSPATATPPPAASPLTQSTSLTNLLSPNTLSQNGSSASSVESGTRLTGRDVSIPLDPTGTVQPRRQLEVVPVTLLPSDNVYQAGNVIAVNSAFICYVVKKTMIRAIQIVTANRSLLRGHNSPIADLKFHSAKNNRLVSIDEGGDLIVWDLADAAGGVGSEFVKLVHIVADPSVKIGYRKVAWHPTKANLFATAGTDGAAVIWNVDELKTQGATIIRTSDLSTISGATVFKTNSEVNDLSFSLDGRKLATGSNDGKLRVWDVESGRCLQEWAPHNGEPVFAALLSTATRPYADNLVLTGSHRNGQLRLWQLEPLTLVQTVTFAWPEDDKNKSDAFNAGGNHISFDSRWEFLFVAHTSLPYFQLLHMRLPTPQPGGLSGSPRFDYLCEFILNEKREEAHPILSFTVTNEIQALPQQHQRNVRDMQLYCIQTQSIQLFKLSSKRCYPPMLAAPDAADFEEIPAFTGEVISAPAEAKPAPKPVVSSQAADPTPAEPEPKPTTPPAENRVSPPPRQTTPPAPVASPPVPAPEHQPEPSTLAVVASEPATQTPAPAVAPAPSTTAPTPATTKTPKEKKKPVPRANNATPTHRKKATTIEGLPGASAAGAGAAVPPSSPFQPTTSQAPASPIIPTATASSPSAVHKSPKVQNHLTVPFPPAFTPSGAPEAERDDFVLSHLDKLVRAQNEHFLRVLDQQKKEWEKAEAERQNQLLSTIAASLNNNLEKTVQKQLKTFIPALGKVISQVMETQVLPQIQEHIKTNVLQQVQTSIASSVESVVKEAVDKQVSQRSLPQGVAETLARSIKDPVAVAFRTTFTDTIIPSFEHACQAMTRQVAATLDKGVKEYIGALPSAGASGTSSAGGEKSSVQDLSVAVKALVDVSEKMTKSIVDTNAKLVRTVTAVQTQTQSQTAAISGVPAPSSSAAPTASTPVPTASTKPSRSSIPNTTPAVAPLSMPPPAEAPKKIRTKPQPPAEPAQPAEPAPEAPVAAPSAEASKQADIREELMRLLRESQFEQVFYKVLRMRDLSILGWLISRVDMKTLLGVQPPVLSQKLMVSLVQQLSFDLTKNTAHKLEIMVQCVSCLSTVSIDAQLAPAIVQVLEGSHSNIADLVARQANKTPANPVIQLASKLFDGISGLVSQIKS